MVANFLSVIVRLTTQRLQWAEAWSAEWKRSTHYGCQSTEEATRKAVTRQHRPTAALLLKWTLALHRAAGISPKRFDALSLLADLRNIG